MTAELINSILLPPFLFIIFFSFASALFYPSRKVGTAPVQSRAIAERKRPVPVTPTTGPSEQRTRDRASQPEAVPQWVGLGKLLDEEDDLYANV